MRRIQWMTLFLGILAVGPFVRSAVAQVGHAPFTYAPFEIDDFERTTIVSPEKPSLGNIGEPIALKNSFVEFEPDVWFRTGRNFGPHRHWWHQRNQSSGSLPGRLVRGDRYGQLRWLLRKQQQFSHRPGLQRHTAT